MNPKPRVTIRYCVRCHWLPRSAWMAQELLYTFADDLGAVELEPSREGGHFSIRVGERLVWDRQVDGGFPEIKVLKRRVRDLIDPSRELGHLDSDPGGPGSQQ